MLLLLFSTVSASADLRLFLANDSTDHHAYVKGEYMCGHFTEDLIRNASIDGIRMYPVYLYGRAGRDHCIAVAVVDGNRYFIEPQSDVCLDYETFKRIYSRFYNGYRIGSCLEHTYGRGSYVVGVSDIGGVSGSSLC